MNVWYNIYFHHDSHSNMNNETRLTHSRHYSLYLSTQLSQKIK